MNMKRQIIICVFLLVLTGTMLFIIITIKQENNVPDNEKEIKHTTESTIEEATEIINEYQYKYYMTEDQGRLTVYDNETKTVFLETAIKSTYLPQEIREDLSDGIYFESDRDLYDFLESYSS